MSPGEYSQGKSARAVLEKLITRVTRQQRAAQVPIRRQPFLPSTDTRTLIYLNVAKRLLEEQRPSEAKFLIMTLFYLDVIPLRKYVFEPFPITIPLKGFPFPTPDLTKKCLTEVLGDASGFNKKFLKRL